MNFIKVLLVLGVGAGSVYYVRQHGGMKALIHEKFEKKNASGFVDVPQPTTMDTATVYVIAAENCPKEDAQRADRLFADLRSRGIRTLRAHSFVIDGPTDLERVQNMNAVANGALPLVFVHGRAKANPTLDDVLKELEGRD